MTIEDFNFHFNNNFESHLSGNGLYHHSDSIITFTAYPNCGVFEKLETKAQAIAHRFVFSLKSGKGDIRDFPAEKRRGNGGNVILFRSIDSGAHGLGELWTWWIGSAPVQMSGCCLGAALS